MVERDIRSPKRSRRQRNDTKDNMRASDFRAMGGTADAPYWTLIVARMPMAYRRKRKRRAEARRSQTADQQLIRTPPEDG